MEVWPTASLVSNILDLVVRFFQRIHGLGGPFFSGPESKSEPSFQTMVFFGQRLSIDFWILLANV